MNNVVIFSYKNVDNLLSLLQNILMYTPPDYNIMVFIMGKERSLENVRTKYHDIIKAFEDRVLEVRVHFHQEKYCNRFRLYCSIDYFLDLNDIRVTDNTFKF